MIKRVVLLLAFIALLAAPYAASRNSTPDVGDRFVSTFCEFYDFLKSILPLAVLIVVVLAGVIFAIGQVLGAETRARANVWATNMLIGGVIAVIVVIIVPWLLDTLVPEFGMSQVCGGLAGGGK